MKILKTPDEYPIAFSNSGKKDAVVYEQKKRKDGKPDRRCNKNEVLFVKAGEFLVLDSVAYGFSDDYTFMADSSHVAVQTCKI